MLTCKVDCFVPESHEIHIVNCYFTLINIVSEKPATFLTVCRVGIASCVLRGLIFAVADPGQNQIPPAL